MDSRILFAVALIFVTVLSCAHAFDKKCMHYCGPETQVDCPSNYTCTNWDGCGLSCLRSTGYQPDHCPMLNCMATDCPLGFERDDKGCEGCNCARMDIIRYIEEQNYKGSASRLAVPSIVSMVLVYTVLNCIY